MLPFVDVHVHLLAGLDDGPKTQAEAVEMCQMLVAEGVGLSVALSHQNYLYPEVTPERILQSIAELQSELTAQQIDLELVPAAEIMIDPDIEVDWAENRYLSIANQRQYVLLEQPNNLYIDIRSVVNFFREQRIRPILAHAERTNEWLYEPGIIEELISMGCLVQVSTSSITQPVDQRMERALRSWFRRGMVHVLGTDAHSPRRRRPLYAQAVSVLRRWIGEAQTEQICYHNGNAVLRGLPLRLIKPIPKTSSWFSRIWN